MIINDATLHEIFINLTALFNQGFQSADSHYKQVAMTVPSQSREEKYTWLAELPALREWLGSRVVHQLSGHAYTIVNRDWESTIEISRNDITDDNLGLFAPLTSEMGRAAAEKPDELVFDLLRAGFSTQCYDGQYFFDSDHPVLPDDGPPTVISNIQDGAAAPWFLLDLSRALKPIVFQEREKPQFERMEEGSDYTFRTGKYMYGVRARSNVGYGLWQLAYGSKAALTPVNYAAARQAMAAMVGETGRKLRVRPTHLVVGPDNEQAARLILKAQTETGGASNVWLESAQLIVTPYLD